MRLAILLVTLMVLAGCSKVPQPKVGASVCNDAMSPIYLKVRLYGGNVPENASMKDYALDRDYDLFYVRGSAQNGTGQINTEGAKFTGMAASDVKLEMQRAGFFSAKKDYDVEVAWRLEMTKPEFNQICELTGPDFYRLKAEYLDPGVADCGWKEFGVNTQRGDHMTRAACDAGPSNLDVLSATFFQTVVTLRARSNAPE